MQIICGNTFDVLKTLPDCSIDCCVTSPPYYNLRDYGIDGQIGLESTPEEYIAKLTDVFREVKRVLKSDGTLWINIADTYAGSGKGKGAVISGKQATNIGSTINENLIYNFSSENIKPKDLIGIPWQLAFALRNDGWYLRSDIIWNKTNAMPQSVRDRPTSSYEHIFLLSKSLKYYFDLDPLKEPVAKSTSNRHKYSYKTEKYLNGNYGQSKQSILLPREVQQCSDTRRGRDIWNIAKNCSRNKHYAAYPVKLAERCILSGCKKNGIVLDPFCGSGTTGVAAIKNDRDYILIDINQEYCDMSQKRIKEITK